MKESKNIITKEQLQEIKIEYNKLKSLVSEYFVLKENPFAITLPLYVRKLEIENQIKEICKN